MLSSGNSNLFLYASGDGNDTIMGFLKGDSISVTGGTVSEPTRSSANVTFTVGTGKIVLRNVADETFSVDNNVITISEIPSVITGTEGANSLSNTITAMRINALGGNDTVTNSGSQAVIFGGAGNDRITNTGAESTINGDAGNDTIISSGNASWLDGGAGADRISLGSKAENVTITGGAGADTIYTNGNDNVIRYGSSEGKDVIFGFDGDDSIEITSGSIRTSVNSGSNKIFYIGTGTTNSITIRDGASKDFVIDGNILSLYAEEQITVSGTSAANNLENEFDGAVIDALAGNDTITNSGSEVLILGGAGNDRVYNYGGDATIDGGAGNDTIFNDGGNAVIDAGAGADRISLSSDAEYNTLIGGAGADTIYSNGNGNVIQYAAGDGKDVIIDFGGDDSIEITGGSVRTSVQSSANVIFYVGTGTSNSITIRDATRSDFRVEGDTISLRNGNGSAAVPWFAEDDDNFISGSANLSDITAENYSVTNIETDSGENLAQGDKTLLTFAEK